MSTSPRKGALIKKFGVVQNTLGEPLFKKTRLISVFQASATETARVKPNSGRIIFFNATTSHFFSWNFTKKKTFKDKPGCLSLENRFSFNLYVKHYFHEVVLLNLLQNANHVLFVGYLYCSC